LGERQWNTRAGMARDVLATPILMLRGFSFYSAIQQGLNMIVKWSWEKKKRSYSSYNP